MSQLLKKNSFISVVIPTLNKRQKFLLEAVNSIENQNYLPLEVIIVNNGEGNIKIPNTSLNIKNFKIVFKGGVSQARNFGACLAEGQYIAFLDDDDLWGPDYLKNIFEKIIIEEPDCLVGRLDQMLSNKITTYKNADKKINIDNILIMNPGITGSSVVIKKSVFMSIGGYNTRLPSGEDKTLILELIDNGYKVSSVSNSQAIIRQSQIDRLSNHKNTYEGISMFYRMYKQRMNLNQKIINLFKIYKNLWRIKKSILNGFIYFLLVLCMLPKNLKEKIKYILQK